MKLEEQLAWEQRLEAMELISALMHQVPLSKQFTTYEMQDKDDYDYLAYIPWIMEDFPQLQKETLLSHINAYLKEE